MNIVINIVLFTATFLSMELTAWFTHKYIMHGVLWKLHKDHHKKDHKGFFEWNDIFFLIFALPAVYFIYSGYQFGWSAGLAIGLGITAYGIAYLFVHDIVVHQRIRWIKNVDHPYLKALRRAHKIHHKYIHRRPSENFGFLIVPLSYIQESRQKHRR